MIIIFDSMFDEIGQYYTHNEILDDYAKKRRLVK